MRFFLLATSIAWLTIGFALPSLAQDQPRNVIFILSDDHRWDFMSFMDEAPDFLETPHMDRMAAEGAHLRNGFVTTSLCSPSRASILTGRYAHNHGVVDNTTPVPEGTRFFPEFLQENGYRTAYVGKWHMGEAHDDPRPGFDRWVSFRGQGVYYDPTLNIDGERIEHEGYVTDILTDYALEWLEEEAGSGEEPFFLYLSHKAVHAEFEPAERHEGYFEETRPAYPETMANTVSNYRGKPDWVREQRGSWHGVDYMYHGDMDFDEFYRRYIETLMALDESVGRVLDYLEEVGLDDNTLVIYMGDNGFLLGEHGLIDKRHAYEESIRVPMLAWSPGYVAPGSVVEALIRNIDIAPTLLDLTETSSSLSIDGASFLDYLSGQRTTADAEDREFLYEYYWEYAFPHTPTTFALRGDRFKYIYYHGVWDTQELYDLENDPQEGHNLIEVPAFQDQALEMRNRLFDRLEAEDAMQVPVRRGTFQAGEKLVGS